MWKATYMNRSTMQREKKTKLEQDTTKRKKKKKSGGSGAEFSWKLKL